MIDVLVQNESFSWCLHSIAAQPHFSLLASSLCVARLIYLEMQVIAKPT